MYQSDQKASKSSEKNKKMEQETLFTSAKWNILKALALEKKSPLELAELANTSMSNISQSLRFLELANIVKSERISNRDKGQPRIVYSLANDNAYLIITATGLVDKKLIPINEHKKIMIKIWLHPDETKHETIEQGYQELRNKMQNIDAIYYEENTNTKLRLILKEPIKTEQITHKDTTIQYETITRTEIEKQPGKYYEIYNPQKIDTR